MERNAAAGRVAVRLGLMGAAAVLAAVLSLCLGPVSLTPAQLWQGLFLFLAMWTRIMMCFPL